MAKKLSERDKLEAVFSNPSLSEVEARHLLDLAGVIVRSRFPGTSPAKRGRKAKPQAEPPILTDKVTFADKVMRRDEALEVAER